MKSPILGGVVLVWNDVPEGKSIVGNSCTCQVSAGIIQEKRVRRIFEPEGNAGKRYGQGSERDLEAERLTGSDASAIGAETGGRRRICANGSGCQQTSTSGWLRIQIHD